MKGIEGVDREVFHRIGKKITAGCTQGGKLTENKGILSTNEEKGRNIPYLSTSYQQIVDKVKKGTVDLEEKY